MINSNSRFITGVLSAFVVMLFVVAVSSQAEHEKVLLISSCASEVKCGDVSIHRFVFRKGQVVSQEIVHTLVTDKAYFLGGDNRIVNGRFAVSGKGQVFDLETKKMYDEREGYVLAVDGDGLYIDEMPDPHLHSGLPGSTFRFDLVTKKYSTYSRPNYYSIFGGRNGPISPDGRKAITFDGLTSDLLVLTKKEGHPGAFSRFVAATGFKATCDKCENNFYFSLRVPSAWVDNDRFLTQRQNGDLVLFDCMTRKWSDVVKIPVARDVSYLPRMFRDMSGNIYYDADKLYQIDVPNKRYSESTEFNLGHGFTVTGRLDTKLFSFEERKLATLISRIYVATEGYLAVEFHEKPLADSYPTGIRVWGKDVGTWTTIKVKYSPRIIGWLSE